jgi:hypothetical protein
MNTPTRDNHPLPFPTKKQKQKRDQWAKALLSGEYNQTNGNLQTVLRTEDGYVFQYCCLGVAEDLHAAGAEWILWDYDEDLTMDTPLYGRGGALVHLDIGSDAMYNLHTKDGQRSGSMPPSEDFQDRYGLNADDVEALAQANDDGATFKDIAKWLTRGSIPKRYYTQW